MMPVYPVRGGGQTTGSRDDGHVRIAQDGPSNAGDAVDTFADVRPEDGTTVIAAIEAAFGSFTTVDIAAGAAPDGGASFTPGAGDRHVTLTSAEVPVVAVAPAV
jgi:hypothetical protein